MIEEINDVPQNKHNFGEYIAVTRSYVFFCHQRCDEGTHHQSSAGRQGNGEDSAMQGVPRALPAARHPKKADRGTQVGVFFVTGLFR